MTLKDKEITLARAIKLAKIENWDTSTKLIPSQKVKEAVLEFENYLTDRQDYFSKNPNTQPRNNFDLILLIESIHIKYKEIFGELSLETTLESPPKKD